MRLLKFAVIALALVSSVSFATPESPRQGAEYQPLRTPQPTQASGKQVEVIEFFMYHCPACNAIEPELAAWVKKRGDSIVFRRIHMPHGPEGDPESRLFLALDSMKLEKSMHEKVLAAWHVERRRLRNDAENLEWAVKNGIDKDTFLAHYNSFSMNARLKGLARAMENYGVDSTPTLIVDGRFLTTPNMVFESNKGLAGNAVVGATLQVVDALIAQAAKGK
jgi:protein dithiol oxidoreductase (disulfide-forming)